MSWITRMLCRHEWDAKEYMHSNYLVKPVGVYVCNKCKKLTFKIMEERDF